MLRAFKVAKEVGLMTIALLGKGGRPAKDLADHALVIPLIGHIFCELIEQEPSLA